MRKSNIWQNCRRMATVFFMPTEVGYLNFLEFFLFFLFTNGKFYDILGVQQSQLNKRTFLGQENYTETAFDKNAGFDEPSLG